MKFYKNRLISLSIIFLSYFIVFNIETKIEPSKIELLGIIMKPNKLNKNEILTADSLKPNIDIIEQNRKNISRILTVLLSNEYLLAVKTQKYHWNVYGKHFGSLHKFFEEQYKQLQEFIDLIAERIRALGFSAIGTLKEFHDNSTLEEEPGIIPNDLGMISSLLEDHEAIISELRENIDRVFEEFDDSGTSNFLAELIVKHEKIAWMLRAFLNKKHSPKDVNI